jgi:hypothetical protein
MVMRNTPASRGLVAVALSVAAVLAAPSAGPAASAPTIVSLAPTSGPMGTQITLQGRNFAAENDVRLSRGDQTFGIDSPVKSENGTQLQLRVHTCPSYAPMCPAVFIPPGDYDLSVTNARGTSNRVKFTVTRP